VQFAPAVTAFYVRATSLANVSNHSVAPSVSRRTDITRGRLTDTPIKAYADDLLPRGCFVVDRTCNEITTASAAATPSKQWKSIYHTSTDVHRQVEIRPDRSVPTSEPPSRSAAEKHTEGHKSVHAAFSNYTLLTSQCTLSIGFLNCSNSIEHCGYSNKDFKFTTNLAIK